MRSLLNELCKLMLSIPFHTICVLWCNSNALSEHIIGFSLTRFSSHSVAVRLTGQCAAKVWSAKHLGAKKDGSETAN